MDANDFTKDLLELRSRLVTDRRHAVRNGKAERLPELVSQIEAIDRSIIEENKLADITQA